MAQWEGTLCNGSYSYKYAMHGDVGRVDFELNEQGTIDIQADIHNIFINGDGSFRGQRTLCIPLKGWFGVGIDSAHLHTLVSFTGTGQNLKDMKVRIVETTFGTIHVGSAVPGWMEKFLTRRVNKGLSKVWGSRMGGWLSEKISDIIRRQMPNRT
jgi:hypothetical protein